jgi:hypothetical protein
VLDVRVLSALGLALPRLAAIDLAQAALLAGVASAFALAGWLPSPPGCGATRAARSGPARSGGGATGRPVGWPPGRPWPARRSPPARRRGRPR